MVVVKVFNMPGQCLFIAQCTSFLFLCCFLCSIDLFGLFLEGWHFSLGWRRWRDQFGVFFAHSLALCSDSIHSLSLFVILRFLHLCVGIYNRFNVLSGRVSSVQAHGTSEGLFIANVDVCLGLETRN